jgi:beta-phosphoglucomutase-like phosphatase (HAD superfamily)
MNAARVPSELREEIVRKRWRHALRLMYRHAGPSIVTRFCLAGLRIDGYPILVASSSTDEFVAGVLWKTGIAKYVDGVLTRDMVAKVKPDPEIYQKALTSLRMTGSEVLAVEDGAAGIAAATAAGCHAMAVHGQMGVSYETVTQRIRDIEGERC